MAQFRSDFSILFNPAEKVLVPQSANSKPHQPSCHWQPLCHPSSQAQLIPFSVIWAVPFHTFPFHSSVHSPLAETGVSKGYQTPIIKSRKDKGCLLSLGFSLALVYSFGVLLVCFVLPKQWPVSLFPRLLRLSLRCFQLVTLTGNWGNKCLIF